MKKIEEALRAVGSKMITGRLKKGTDLIQGLKEACERNHIINGKIISCIGSLKKATYIYAIDDEKNKIRIRYCEPVTVEGPLELITCQGTIGRDNEKSSIHLHGVFSDKEKNIYGGHFVEKNNIILATVEFLIIGFESPVISKYMDRETEFNLFKYTKKVE